MDQSDWNARYATKELVWTAEANRFVVQETSGLAPGRAIDLAAGEGRNAVWLAEQGWKATAVDFSDVAIGKARELAAHRQVDIDTVVADVTAFEPEPGAYDLVLIAYLQVPDADRRAAYAHAAAGLAPGGTMLVVGHDRSNLDGGYGGPSDPAVMATPDEVAALLSAQGLTVQKAQRVERTVDTAEGPRIAFDHVVVAVR